MRSGDGIVGEGRLEGGHGVDLEVHQVVMFLFEAFDLAITI